MGEKFGWVRHEGKELTATKSSTNWEVIERFSSLRGILPGFVLRI
jgi:hypothetical protein